MCFSFRKVICFSCCEKNTLLFRLNNKKRSEKQNAENVLLAEKIRRIPYRRLNCSSLFVASVRIARPEEAFQPVFAASRHNVCVQMRHALADAIVHGDKGAVSFHRRFDHATKKLRILEE